jgi:phosphatidylinositol alpha-1,6-mannosyltransferase
MIIVLTQCFPSRLGGIESLMHNLSINLANHKKILVLADSYDLKKDEVYDTALKGFIKVKRVNGLKFYRRRKKIKLLKSIVNSENVSCVIGDSWKSFELAIEFLILSKIPTICLAHGNELIKKNNNQYKRLLKTLNQVSSIVCNSDFTLRLINKIDIKVPIVKRIYPGAEDANLIKEKLVPYVTGSPILITISRLEKRKGHKHVIESVLKLKQFFPKIQYVIAGTGSELNNLKKIVKILRLEEHVIFVGNVNKGEKNFLLKRANLMVMPTIDEISNRSIEGFGISYIEASFFSIPSIASNIGGTSEAVLNNKTGIILEKIEDLYEKMKLLLSNNAMLKSLGKNAQERSLKEFQWTVIVEKYLKLINDLEKNKL